MQIRVGLELADGSLKVLLGWVFSEFFLGRGCDEALFSKKRFFQ